MADLKKFGGTSTPDSFSPSVLDAEGFPSLCASGRWGKSLQADKSSADFRNSLLAFLEQPRNGNSTATPRSSSSSNRFTTRRPSQSRRDENRRDQEGGLRAAVQRILQRSDAAGDDSEQLRQRLWGLCRADANGKV